MTAGQRTSPTLPSLPSLRPLLWALLIGFCIVWFYTLGGRTLVPTDEGRYAEMAREMVATGDWITPRLNAIKYFEKPPLQVWMTAIAFKLFGLGEWQARLWTGLCGLFGILLTAHTGSRLFNERVGIMAGAVLGSSLLWAALGHINTLDMGLSGMMALALCGLLLAQRHDASPQEQRNWMLVCWAGMALAVLSKGLIGVVLPGAVLVLYTVLSRDWKIWTRLHLGLGLLVFFAITVPWFVLVWLKNPEHPYFFFIHEHFQRFTTKVHHREGPWYYFIPILLLGILPWLGSFFQSLWHARDTETSGFKPKTMMLVWAGFIFFFFSISHSKLPSYILPIFPALALLLASYLESASRKTWLMTSGLMAIVGVAGLAAASRLSSMTSDPIEMPLYQAAQPWVIAASVVMLIGAFIVVLWSRRENPDLPLRATLALGIAGFLAGQLLMIGSEPYGRYRSGAPLVPAIEAELTPSTKLYAVGLYDQTLPFYLRRTMTLVAHADELEFGLEQEPQLWLPTRDAFIAQWTAGPKAVAITRPEIFAELQKQNVPMRVVAKDARRVVITNDLKK
jgi:4-amino-4-deoxy-L-arabinose transferase-like glycosyltransferase